ncbi:MAG: tetraacyldisaccharide 4'-kinase [Bacteroidetes bacterium]|nr:tetraacyldisaccharide 4'-kinase [Bacteroidota bacterium]
MNFNAVFLKTFRFILLPVSIIYGLVVYIRNFLFDKKILRSVKFNFPIICVGNLVMGGTGKSTMVEFLVDHLRHEFQLATLSRGYKRRTKGYIMASEKTGALEIGDEPMQFHIKYPDISVAVCEDRLLAVPQILQDKPTTNVIILDDAFQHRAIEAGMNILLTQYGDLYIHDFFLPSGDLRDKKSSAIRANIIVVTKCPAGLKEDEKKAIEKKLHLTEHQSIYFSTIEYGLPYHILSKEERLLSNQDEVLLVCGIANPDPLKKYLEEHTAVYYQQNFSDHHIYSIDDLKNIAKKFAQIQCTDKLILTTEKDAVRLHKFESTLLDLPFYVLPIRNRILFNEEEKFIATLRHYITGYQNQE